MGEYKYGVFTKDKKLYGMFGTPVKQILIRFLAENPDKKFSVQELQKKNDLAGSSVSVALSELEELGLVQSQKEGKFKYYLLSSDYAQKFADIYEKLDSVYQIALRNKKRKGG